MDHQERDNFVLLEGRAAGEPRYSHAARSQRFYTLPLEALRLSGASDTLNVTIRESMLDALVPHRPLRLEGELRSFNSRSGRAMSPTDMALAVSGAVNALYFDRDGLPVQG